MPPLSVVRVAVLLSWLALPTLAGAADKSKALYKCVDPNGATSIQSDGCPAGSTTAWRRLATAEAPLTPEQVAQAEARRQRDQQTVRELSEIVERKLQAASTPLPPAREESPPVDAPAEPVDPCITAQEFAGSLRDKPWLALSEQQTQRVYGWVAEQCKAPAP